MILTIYSDSQYVVNSIEGMDNRFDFLATQAAQSTNLQEDTGYKLRFK